MNRQKLIFFIIISVIVSCGSMSMAQFQCESLFEVQPKLYEELKQIAESKSVSQLLRSNSTHYWKWIKNKASKYFFKDVIAFKGRVVGDPHNKNFGFLKFKDKIFWTVIDADDAGNAPLILDFARFVAAVKSVGDVKTKELWSFYLMGLRGEELAVPPIVLKAAPATAQKYLKEEVKKAKKFSTIDGLKLKNDGVESSIIEDIETQALVMQEFQDAFKGTERVVLDVGGREKDRGGSQEALRFIALVKGDDGQNTLYELKEDLGSSVGVFMPQAKDNLENTLDFYIRSRVTSDIYDPSYQVLSFKVEGKQRTFLLRPKQLYFFDAANSADTVKEANEFHQLSIYNAWFMGRIHGQQEGGSSYANLLNADAQGPIFEGVKSSAKDYLEYLLRNLKLQK